MDLVIDALGRLVIPKAIRQHLKLRPGAALRAQIVGGHLELTPVGDEPSLMEEHGVLVVRSRTGARLTAEEVDRVLDEERDARST
jgi:AbrB family looped-hinge helix DNA binding protein